MKLTNLSAMEVQGDSPFMSNALDNFLEGTAGADNAIGFLNKYFVLFIVYMAAESSSSCCPPSSSFSKKCRLGNGSSPRRRVPRGSTSALELAPRSGPRVMSEEIDKHVLRKYEIQQKLGKGVSNARVVCLPPRCRVLGTSKSCGRSSCAPTCRGDGLIVWKAVDKKTRDTVALKKIFDAFQNATDAQVRADAFALGSRCLPRVAS